MDNSRPATSSPLAQTSHKTNSETTFAASQTNPYTQGQNIKEQQNEAAETTDNPAIKLKRTRAKRSCDFCRKRKSKCDADWQVECEFTVDRKKRGPPSAYVDAMEARMKKMETLLTALTNRSIKELEKEHFLPNPEDFKKRKPKRRARKTDEDEDTKLQYAVKTEDAVDARHLASQEDEERPVGMNGDHEGDHDDGYSEDTEGGDTDENLYQDDDFLEVGTAIGSASFMTSLSHAHSVPTNLQQLRNSLQRGSIKRRSDASMDGKRSSKRHSGQGINWLHSLGGDASANPLSHAPVAVSAPVSVAGESNERHHNSMHQRFSELRISDLSSIRYMNPSAGLHLLDNAVFQDGKAIAWPGKKNVFLQRVGGESDGTGGELVVVKAEPSGARRSSAEISSGEVGGKRRDKVYDWPPRSFCDHLIDLYMKYIHPTIPIINKHDFMKRYHTENPTPLNPFLTNSIFAVTTARHIQDDIPHPASGTNISPMELAKIFYARGVEHYQGEFARPRLSTVQAFIVSTLWFEMESEDDDSCQWFSSGAAIRMAQDLGLHRNSSKWRIPKSEVELRRRIWYACYVIDRWMCTQMGRPLTILDRDNDVDLPSAYEIEPEDETDTMGPVDHPPKGLPVYENFIQLIKLSDILGRVLKGIYAPKVKNTSSNLAVQSLVQVFNYQLVQWRTNLPEELRYEPERFQREGREMSRFAGPLQMCFYTVLLLLHRPFMTPSQDFPSTVTTQAISIATNAASSIIEIAEAPESKDFACYSWTIVIYTILQAGLVHLHNAALAGQPPHLKELAWINLKRTLACLERKHYRSVAQRSIDVLNMLISLKEVDISDPPERVMTPNALNPLLYNGGLAITGGASSGSDRSNAPSRASPRSSPPTLLQGFPDRGAYESWDGNANRQRYTMDPLHNLQGQQSFTIPTSPSDGSYREFNGMLSILQQSGNTQVQSQQQTQSSMSQAGSTWPGEVQPSAALSQAQQQALSNRIKAAINANKPVTTNGGSQHALNIPHDVPMDGVEVQDNKNNDSNSNRQTFNYLSGSTLDPTILSDNVLSQLLNVNANSANFADDPTTATDMMAWESVNPAASNYPLLLRLFAAQQKRGPQGQGNSGPGVNWSDLLQFSQPDKHAQPTNPFHPFRVQQDQVAKKRGPHKGYIENLENRLEKMEQLLKNMTESQGASSRPRKVARKTSLSSESSEDYASPSLDETEDQLRHAAKNETSRNVNTINALLHSADNGHANDEGDNRRQSTSSDPDTNEDATCSARYMGSSSGLFMISKEMQHHRDEKGQPMTMRSLNPSGGDVMMVRKSARDNEEYLELRKDFLPPEASRRVIALYVEQKSAHSCLLTSHLRFLVHIYPCIPIINMSRFLAYQWDPKASPPDPLLLNAIYLVTARQLSPNDEVFSTLNISRESFIALCENTTRSLMDQEYAQPKMSTVQAMLLMTNLSNSKDSNVRWLTSGLAIRMAQDLGLHRSASRFKMSKEEEETRRRVWWACYCLDRWTCASLGRPLAIHDSDCDVEMPSTADLGFQDISRFAGANNIVKSMDQTYGAFTHLVRLSTILGHILKKLYTPKANAMGYGKNMHSTLKDLSDQLKSWLNSLPEPLIIRDTRNVVSPYAYGLRLCYNTARILLFRPFITPNADTSASPSVESDPSRASARVCATAAVEIIDLTEAATDKQILGFPWGFMVYTLMQANLIYLFNNYKNTPESPSPLRSPGKGIDCLRRIERLFTGGSHLTEFMEILLQRKTSMDASMLTDGEQQRRSPQTHSSPQTGSPNLHASQPLYASRQTSSAPISQLRGQQQQSFARSTATPQPVYYQSTPPTHPSVSDMSPRMSMSSMVSTGYGHPYDQPMFVTSSSHSELERQSPHMGSLMAPAMTAWRSQITQGGRNPALINRLFGTDASTPWWGVPSGFDMNDIDAYLYASLGTNSAT
ncbi:hypothetical protein BZG36_04409 [Bifiguratus adelaidae]|uniref:Transcription factor domain-containing protein n=1 Tax=Bifiguratus adelaidae TaxID=1938954 RepID=A0A261XWD3_9FUNG|nr:hypothetical protein BZG36_04409 [Bifiguratus adelaidae]